MMLAPERLYRSPTNQSSNENRSSLMTPPQLSPRRIGSDSVASRTMMVSRSLTPSLFLPMDLEHADNGSFRRSLFGLKPRNESTSDEASTLPPITVPTRPLLQTQTPLPALVTPRCQPRSTRKRQRDADSEGEEAEDEEICKLNVPKKLMLSLDD